VSHLHAFRLICVAQNFALAKDGLLRRNPGLPLPSLESWRRFVSAVVACPHSKNPDVLIALRCSEEWKSFSCLAKDRFLENYQPPKRRCSFCGFHFLYPLPLSRRHYRIPKTLALANESRMMTTTTRLTKKKIQKAAIQLSKGHFSTACGFACRFRFRRPSQGPNLNFRSTRQHFSC